MARQFRVIPKHIPLATQVRDYLDWCEPRQREATLKTKYWQYARLYQDMGLKRLEDLTNEVMEAWLRAMKRGGSGAVGLNRAMTCVKCLVEWHREMGNNKIPIKLLLLERVKVNASEQVFYTRQEIYEVIKHAKDPQAKLMILIMFDTGMRASELMRLRLAHIRGQKLTFTAKGGRMRVTYISRSTMRKLRRYVRKNGIEDFLWPGKHDGHIAYNTFLLKIRKPFYEMGFKDFHPHALRHSFVADLEAREATNDEIQVLIGHANPKTTMVYRHRIRKDMYLRELHKKFHKWR